MTSDDNHDLRELWEYANVEALFVEIGRWNAKAQGGQGDPSGDDGLPSGGDPNDPIGSTYPNVGEGYGEGVEADRGVKYPDDFDHDDYNRWADEVDEIWAAEELQRLQELEQERRDDR